MTIDRGLIDTSLLGAYGLEGQFDEGQEVYSRFFPDDYDLPVILEKYFPDYVFEDAKE